MSRIGRKSITVPAGVKVQVNASTRAIDFQGPKGKLTMIHRPEVKVAYNDAEKRIVCEVPDAALDVGNNRAYWGTTRSVINGMVEGVLKGYEKKLEIVGVGWGAKVQGKKLVLTIGFANAVEVPIPANVNVAVNGTTIEVTGPNKQTVGAFASDVRACRKPEPYNGKGIKYVDEVIQRKQGKAFGS